MHYICRKKYKVAMEDKMIEIARFQQATDAEILASLLRSEGVECYVRNGLSSSAMFGNESGGAKVELLEKDALRAAEIMKDHGYEAPVEWIGEVAPEMVSKKREQARADYERSKARLSKAMIIIIVLMVLLFVLLIFLNKNLNGE
jgi:hypothetical protein